jgi:hypothetical protein
MLKNFVLLKTGVDVSPLVDALEKNPCVFNQITARQEAEGSAHKYTEAVFLRWCVHQTIEAAFTEIDAIDYPALDLLPEACPLIAEVLERVDATHLGRVLITNLHPGGVIDPHSDEGAVADHYERFHVVLSSDEGNLFYSKIGSDEFESVHMKPGEVWFFNHKRVHRLVNRSDRPRLHLIIDCVAPTFRRERDALSA